ncbi:transcriptional regulator family: Fungal Specific TF [Paecilomyces variotii]|nr:transcriptional regulator family: Fungal Specific TF [Paecilomyces variotii]KAJ9372167.1 transcriptional regulator family: Fungal Specific TF [Paecilomyces variotii]
MPNTGKPSQGCQLCRQRRVKCDPQRPECQRCIKYGVACPGYRDQQELMFRNANAATIEKRKNRSMQAVHHASSSSDPSDQLTVHDVKMATAVTAVAQPAHVRTIYEHWSLYSVPIVLDICPALELLADMYHDTLSQNHLPDSPLVWVSHLFSRTYTANLRHPVSCRRGSELETQRELSNYLTKTLRAVRHALQTHEGVLRDDILLTVWMLTNYEIMVGSLRREQAQSPWHLHSRGLYSILKARGTTRLYTARGRAVFWLAFITVQIGALSLNSECPPESEEWLGVIKSVTDTSKSYIYHVSLFIVRTCAVASKILKILNSRDFSAASRDYDRLVAEFTTAEKDYDAFLMANPIPTSLAPPVLNFQRSGVIKGHRFLHLLANFLTHDPAQRFSLPNLEAQRNYSVRKIRVAAQDILNSVPVCINHFSRRGEQSPKLVSDALRLIWPLTTICIFKPTLPAQKREAARILDFIGKEIGVRQAFDRDPAPRCKTSEGDTAGDNRISEHIYYFNHG